MPDRHDSLDDARGAPDLDDVREVDSVREPEDVRDDDAAPDAVDDEVTDARGPAAEGDDHGDEVGSPDTDDDDTDDDDTDDDDTDERAGAPEADRAGSPDADGGTDTSAGPVAPDGVAAPEDAVTPPTSARFVPSRPTGGDRPRSAGSHARVHTEPEKDALPSGPPPRFTPAAPSGTRRLWKAITQRPDLGHVGVGLLVALLGFGAVVQVRADDDDTLANARRDDLVQILDGLRRQADRLDDHVAELEVDRRDLVSGADTEAEALELAQERARSVGVLAGTVPATGSGIIMTITDPDHQVHAVLMLQAINELRVAGAEAIQIRGRGNDTAVRVIADTAFENPEPGVLRVGGVDMEPPYEIVAIGDPRELSGAMTFAEGIVQRIEDEDADATVTEYDELTVDVLHEPRSPKYAHPAPDDEDDE
ncbi:DUF881 domain-containing protein [Jiangella asiatica]|uniref:DUF881 domain-containing protein n=1 Tax=Jiangella asiatica TaxID=2530372 RepID=A0A4V2Z3F0_9ACTN|nr:DUF881 domain-containing protein [Jiangella asiatica]TDE12228.1 DUF881 domain-containing protein [Jiangella asiatica]